MADEFTDNLIKEFTCIDHNSKSNIIKADNLKVAGIKKVSIEDEAETGIKIVLEKDENDQIKEIKFYCSCGQTKSIILDYSD